MLDSSEPIRCAFRTYDLLSQESMRAECEFDALSYAWGGTFLGETIILNEQRFWITRSLFEALRMLRWKMHADTKNVGLRPLWVDALCIDQDDVEERSQQVLLMREIYTRAHFVHIWPGDRSPALEALFDKWRQLLAEDDATGLTAESMDQRPLDVSIFSPSLVDMLDRSDGTYNGLKDFVERPWWSRLWVQQEVLLANTPLFHLGQVTYPFKSIFGFLQRIAFWCDYQRPILDTFALERTIEDVVPRLHSIVNRYVQQGFRTLYPKEDMALRTIFTIGVHCESTDSRDRIYGLLGLLPPDIGIVPDYTVSVETVFEDAAYEIMKWSKSLDILHLYSPDSEAPGATGGPTWIPRFAHSNAIPGNPSPGSTFFVEKRRRGTLTVKAFIADTILACSPHVNGILKEDGYELPNLSRLRFVARYWKDFAKSISIPSPPAPFSDITFWRTVIMIDQTLVPGVASNPTWDDELLWNAALEAWLNNSPPASSDYTLPMWSWLMLHRSFASSTFIITNKGRYATAVVSENVVFSADDVVAVLAGCTYVFILRPASNQENTYTIVALCYCDGIMNGEAVREAALEKTGSEDNVDDIMREIDLV